MKKTHPLLLLSSLALMLAACSSPESSPDAAQASGNPSAPDLVTTTGLGEAPDFTLPTLDGDSLGLSALEGQIVVVNFWATWCAPCLEEIPELIALHDDLNPHGLTVLGVAIDAEGEVLVRPFAERLDITYPILLDDGTAAEAFGGMFALPTTYVIDPERQISQRVIGLYPVKEMYPEFRKMLNLPPVSTTAH